MRLWKPAGVCALGDRQQHEARRPRAFQVENDAELLGLIPSPQLDVSPYSGRLKSHEDRGIGGGIAICFLYGIAVQ